MSKYPRWVVDRLIEPQLRGIEPSTLVLTWTVGRGVPENAPTLGESDGFSRPLEWEIAQMRRAAILIEAVSGVKLVETDSRKADVHLHAFDSGELLGWAHATFAQVQSKALAMQRASADFTRGEWFQTLLHELGHIAGLKHPHDGLTIPDRFDDNRHTVMTYNDVAKVSAKYRPMDILALRKLYGGPSDLRAREGEDGAARISGGRDADRVKLTGLSMSSDGPMHQLLGRGGDDRLEVVDGAWTLDGGGGDDRLLFAGREARLFGGGGDDRITARSGEVHAEGGRGDDRLTALGELAPRDLALRLATGPDGLPEDLVEVPSTVGATLRGGGGDDRLQGANRADALAGDGGADRLFGEARDDALNGGNGDDRIFGGAGDDEASGGRGDDRMSGGRGADGLRGGAGDDEASGDEGADALRGGAGDDVLRGGAGADLLRGGGGDDRLNGGAGADVLTGGGGADALRGGLGADLLIGGDGADRFVFAPTEAPAVDAVADFETGLDVLVFDGLTAPDLRLAADGDDVLVQRSADGSDIARLLDTALADVDAGRFDFI